MILSGGEDGRITGWDMNSQEKVIDSQLNLQTNNNSTFDIGSNSNKMLVSTLDYCEQTGVLAACGNFKGMYVNYLSNLEE